MGSELDYIYNYRHIFIAILIYYIELVIDYNNIIYKEVLLWVTMTVVAAVVVVVL